MPDIKTSLWPETTNVEQPNIDYEGENMIMRMEACPNFKCVLVYTRLPGIKSPEDDVYWTQHVSVVNTHTLLCCGVL